MLLIILFGIFNCLFKAYNFQENKRKILLRAERTEIEEEKKILEEIAKQQGWLANTYFMILFLGAVILPIILFLL